LDGYLKVVAVQRGPPDILEKTTLNSRSDELLRSRKISVHEDGRVPKSRTVQKEFSGADYIEFVSHLRASKEGVKLLPRSEESIVVGNMRTKVITRSKQMKKDTIVV